MQRRDTCLGLTFFEHQLFYGVYSPQQDPSLAHVGAIDFSFDVSFAVHSVQEDHLAGVREAITHLKDSFTITQFRMLLHPTAECWTTLPKLVYDNSAERESHINLLMNGTDRDQIQATWHSLSNETYKLLQLRTRQAMQGMQKMAGDIPEINFLSAFEIGERWIQHAHPGGSFLTICCFRDCISVSSFILGKLRGATYIRFDHPEDLPYLWLQQARVLTWMQGLHEQIQVYGQNAYHIIEILEPFWDDAGTVTKMDSLQKMQVHTDETTYGFDLELAYPAIMLAVG